MADRTFLTLFDAWRGSSLEEVLGREWLEACADSLRVDRVGRDVAYATRPGTQRSQDRRDRDFRELAAHLAPAEIPKGEILRALAGALEVTPQVLADELSRDALPASGARPGSAPASAGGAAGSVRAPAAPAAIEPTPLAILPLGCLAAEPTVDPAWVQFTLAGRVLPVSWAWEETLATNSGSKREESWEEASPSVPVELFRELLRCGAFEFTPDGAGAWVAASAEHGSGGPPGASAWASNRWDLRLVPDALTMRLTTYVDVST